jgi:aspartate 1-decarboxylase
MALYRMVGGKIHRATVTETELDYEGSISIDPELYERAGFRPGELLQVYNLANGARFETYLIDAPRGSGMVGVRGAAAHLADIGDKLIIVNVLMLDESELAGLRFRVVRVDAHNRPVEDTKA